MKIFVLGGGPGGLCAAWNLLQDGYEVTVLEKEPVCGGQSVTFRRGGYRYDLGPHNIHSQRGSVIKFLKKNLGDDFVKHDFSAQIYFRSRRINYPFVGVDIIKSINLFTAISCLLSFLSARAAAFLSPRLKDDGSYRTWIVNRFGRKFYDIYFGPYSQKVWCTSPELISDVVAKKRIAVSGIMELIHSLLFKKQQYHPENPAMIDNYYPKEGVGAIADFFIKGIKEKGGEIITGAKVERIILEDNRVREIGCRLGNTTKTFRPGGENGNAGCMVLSTIPVNEMAAALEGGVPEGVFQAAEGLTFTSEVFLYLNVRQPDIFRVPLLYFSEPEFMFNRIYDIGIFSPKMLPPGKGAICLEISCMHKDRTWMMDEKELFNRCIGPLEKHGLLRRGEVEDYHVRRLEHAYPLFKVGYEKKLKQIFNFINGVPNLISFGRQGLFTYANVDDSIWMAFEVSKHVRYQGRFRLSIKELLPHYISF